MSHFQRAEQKNTFFNQTNVIKENKRLYDIASVPLYDKKKTIDARPAFSEMSQKDVA